MKICLVCQTDADRAELLRIPIRVEGNLLGDMLVCRRCFDLLGTEEVKSIVSAAVAGQAYESSQFIPAEGSAGENGSALPNSAEFPVTAELLDDSRAFAQRMGEALAPLLLARYRAGQNRVNLLTVCGEGENGLVFRALAESP